MTKDKTQCIGRPLNLENKMPKREAEKSCFGSTNLHFILCSLFCFVLGSFTEQQE